MRINLLDVFKTINEIYAVRQMNVAERILLRQKKDLVSYIAVHIWSIVKTILVFLVLFSLIEKADWIGFNTVYVYILVGITFLIFDSVGFKAIIFLIQKFIMMLFNIHKSFFSEIYTFFYKASRNTIKYTLLVKCVSMFFNVVIFLLLFPLFYALNLFILILIYSIIIAILIFLNNETLSLIITHVFITKVPFLLSSEVLKYVFYIASLAIMYFIIDYRVRVTNQNLLFEDSFDFGTDLVKGLPISSASSTITIFKKDKKIYVLNNMNSNVKVYRLHSKLDEIKNNVEQWFNQRSNLKKIKLEEENTIVKKEIEKLDFTNSTIFNGYNSRKVDIELLEKSSNDKQEQINKILDREESSKDKVKGVYIFVSKNKICLDKSFIEVVELYSKHGRKYKYERLGASEYIHSDRENRVYPIEIGENEIIYIGKSADVLGRTREHLSSNKHNGTMSLKLGFETRSVLKEQMDCYILIEDDEDKRANLERNIRDEYGSHFGTR